MEDRRSGSGVSRGSTLYSRDLDGPRQPGVCFAAGVPAIASQHRALGGSSTGIMLVPFLPQTCWQKPFFITIILHFYLNKLSLRKVAHGPSALLLKLPQTGGISSACRCQTGFPRNVPLACWLHWSSRADGPSPRCLPHGLDGLDGPLRVARGSRGSSRPSPGHRPAASTAPPGLLHIASITSRPRGASSPPASSSVPLQPSRLQPLQPESMPTDWKID